MKSAKRGWVPDPTFRVEGDRYNDASQAVSEVSAGISIDWPWFNRSKYHGAIAENQKLLESALREMEAARSETLGLVVDQFHKVETLPSPYRTLRMPPMPLAREASMLNAAATNPTRPVSWKF